MAYESKLTITFGPQHERGPMQREWDFVWQAGMPAPAGIPAELAAATLGVGCDLLNSADVTARFPTLRWAFRAGEGSLGVLDLTSISPVPVLEAHQVTVAIADIVQDQLCGYEFIQWPMCPEHQHPMRPAVSAGLPSWTCPTTARRVVPIGSLGT
jgi:hypothetical protein